MAKKIKETKCTCKACGNVWYYGKKEMTDWQIDKLENSAKRLSNISDDLLCCSGCLPAVFIPKEQIKDVKDLNKCPKCNSSALKKEDVIHEINE